MYQSKVKSVTSIEKYFPITWQIGARCNYDCMYCPEEYHNDTDSSHSLEVLQNAWRKFYQQAKSTNLKFKITITGGEPTVNKNLIPFLQWLAEEYADHLYKVIITSNGSASYNYYYRLFNYCDSISLSTHSEHINEDSFFETVIKLSKTISDKKFLHVNIMNEYWNTENIENWKELLTKEKISYSINEIYFDAGTRDYPIFKNK